MPPDMRAEPSTTVIDLATHRETGDGDPAGFGCVLDAIPIDTAPIDAEPIDGQGSAAIVVLRMVGEIDLATRATMATALHGGLQAGPRHLLVDLSGVRFCGAHGFAQLADTAHAAAEHDIGYALCGLSPHVGRVATTLWGPDGPTRYRSLAAAVTTIRAGHARRERMHEVRTGFA